MNVYKLKNVEIVNRFMLDRLVDN